MDVFEKRVVESFGAPDINELWLDISQTPAVLKTYHRGEWKPVIDGTEEKDNE